MMPASSWCDETVDNLVDIAEGAGPEHLAVHAKSCATCQRRMQDMQAVAGAVRAMPRIALPAGFETRLNEELVRRAPGESRRARWPWLVGVAALAAVIVAVLLFRTPDASSVDMGLAQRVEVDIAVHSVAALDAVDMRVALPEGVSIASDDPEFDGAHTLHFNAPLVVGMNHFPIVLKPDAVGAHRVHVDIAAGHETAGMDVVVNVQPNEHATNMRTRVLPVLALRDASDAHDGRSAP